MYGKTYQAEEGMTWREFIPSAYNTDGDFLTSDSFGDTVFWRDEGGFLYINSMGVSIDDEIVSGGDYEAY